MAKLNRDLILKSNDIVTEEVAVAEWGGEVLVRGMSGAERDAYEHSLVLDDDQERRIDTTNIRAKLVARCVVDEQGKRIFTDEDIEALGNKNAAPLDRICDVARRLSGMGRAEKEKLAKNSAPAGGDLSSSLPAT